MSKMTQFTFKTGILTSFKDSKIKGIDSVPVGNMAAYKALVGEAEVHEFINVVHLGEDYKAQLDPWTDIVLTEEWAKSFATSMKESPKPLFIPGHSDADAGFKMRAIPDGYMTGGMVSDDRMYLRNTLIIMGTEEKKELIEQTTREIAAGMLSTSSSDYMKYEIETDEDGNSTYFAIESVKGQSNALVEADMTASKADIVITSFKAEIDSSDEKEEGVKHMAEKTMSNAEMYTVLKNQLESGHLALKDVASGLGIEMVTAKQRTALKRLNDAESIVGDISEFVTGVVADQEAAFVSLKEAKIKEKFETDELIEIATPLFNLKEGNAEAIDVEVERLSGLQIFKTIQGRLAEGVTYTPGNKEGGEGTDETENKEEMEG